MIKNVKVENVEVYFIFKPIPNQPLTSLKSQIEVNLEELINDIKNCNFPHAHFICEGGWYFNKPDKVISALSQYKLSYIILNPSLRKLREQYTSRHPRTKKDINNDLDWEDYEKAVFKPMLKSNEKLKLRLRKLGFVYHEFNDEALKVKEQAVVKEISKADTPTIFIITGPNASGKSTLLYNLMKRTGAL